MKHLQFTKKGPGRRPAGHATPKPRHDFKVEWGGGKILKRGKCRKCGAKYLPPWKKALSPCGSWR
jgi:hypothetical protein